jgi:hypothetical protein
VPGSYGSSSSARSDYSYDQESLISYHSNKGGVQQEEDDESGRGVFLLILIFLTAAAIIAYMGVDITVANDIAYYTATATFSEQQNATVPLRR